MKIMCYFTIALYDKVNYNSHIVNNYIEIHNNNGYIEQMIDFSFETVYIIDISFMKHKAARRRG